MKIWHLLNNYQLKNKKKTLDQNLVYTIKMGGFLKNLLMQDCCTLSFNPTFYIKLNIIIYLYYINIIVGSLHKIHLVLLFNRSLLLSNKLLLITLSCSCFVAVRLNNAWSVNAGVLGLWFGYVRVSGCFWCLRRAVFSRAKF